MSKQSWMEEFYPDDLEADEQSLGRWIGLRPENLSKHGVSSGLIMVSTDCALCKTHTYEGQLCCERCPLFKVDKRACRNTGAWGDLIKYKDPEPMIKLLKETVKIRLLQETRLKSLVLKTSTVHKVIIRHNDVVMCELPDNKCTPYVVWRVSPHDNSTFSGTYCATLPQALRAMADTISADTIYE